MEDIIIYGAGGLAKEVTQLIEDINRVEKHWNILGYIDDFRGDCGEYIFGYPVLGCRNVLKCMKKPVNVVIAVGEPLAKRKIYDGIKDYPVLFPHLVHPTAIIAPSSRIGEGTVITAYCILSVNVTVGNHVLLNPKTFIGHDSMLCSFVSCYVGCTVNGNVTLNENVLLGSGSVIMEKKNIGENVRVSMGSIVSFDVAENQVVVTRPSKAMSFNAESV